MKDNELLWFLLGTNLGLAIGVVVAIVTLVAVFVSFRRRGLL